MSNSFNSLCENTVDNLIKYAVSLEADNFFDSLEESMSDSSIVFSDEHTRKINEIINKEKQNIYLANRRKINRRIFISLIAAAILILALAVTVAAYRYKNYNVISKTTKVLTEFYVEKDNNESLIMDFNTSIGYIPDGFEEELLYKNEREYYARYKNTENNEDELFFDIDKENIPDTYTLNTEDANIRYIDINGCKAFCSFAENYKIINWINGDYLFTVMGNIDEAELINIAENLY